MAEIHTENPSHVKYAPNAQSQFVHRNKFEALGESEAPRGSIQIPLAACVKSVIKQSDSKKKTKTKITSNSVAKNSVAMPSTRPSTGTMTSSLSASSTSLTGCPPVDGKGPTQVADYNSRKSESGFGEQTQREKAQAPEGKQFSKVLVDGRPEEGLSKALSDELKDSEGAETKKCKGRRRQTAKQGKQCPTRPMTCTEAEACVPVKDAAHPTPVSQDAGAGPCAYVGCRCSKQDPRKRMGPLCGTQDEPAIDISRTPEESDAERSSAQKVPEQSRLASTQSSIPPPQSTGQATTSPTSWPCSTTTTTLQVAVRSQKGECQAKFAEGE